tara:strand:+ start:1041 stop:1226 length:186 start_codon:yes stop_codon:yes gene_type:complete
MLQAVRYRQLRLRWWPQSTIWRGDVILKLQLAEAAGCSRVGYLILDELIGLFARRKQPDLI